MKIDKISIIIPVFNEENFIEKTIYAVEAANLSYEKELIIVDDGSTDKTQEILGKYADKYKMVFMGRNCGKGAALRRGFAMATGDVVIIQDADLEYDPNQFGILIEPILSGFADVVYGSRFITVFPRRILYFWHYLANRFLTGLSNVLTNLNLSDMETGYKVFTAQAIKQILPCLRASRFGIEPEITAQIAKHKLRIYEVGIAYHGRTYSQGKKINWKDGLAAIFFIIKYNLFTRK
jgi:glycosyltransferase involved in cell wall biosynthesis